MTAPGPASLTVWAQELHSGARRADPAVIQSVLEAAAAAPDDPLMRQLADFKAVSMLAVETLALMYGFALEARGAILEIGAYAGGGTLALALAAQRTGAQPVIAVDRGGSYLGTEHRIADIEAAWRGNLARHDLAGQARLIVGDTGSEGCRMQIREAAGQARLRLICVDADGFVWSHLAGLADLIDADCLLMVDDLAPPDPARPKRGRTQAAMADALAAGAVVTYGLAPWSTWFGRATGSLLAALPRLAAAEATRRALEDPRDLPPAAGTTSRAGFTPRT